MAKAKATVSSSDNNETLKGFAKIKTDQDGWWFFNETPGATLVGNIIGYRTMMGMNNRPVNFYQVEILEKALGVTKEGEFEALPGQVLAVRESKVISELRYYVGRGPVALVYKGKKKKKNGGESFHDFEIMAHSSVVRGVTPTRPVSDIEPEDNGPEDDIAF